MFKYLLLGLLQGITEFLPVSSTGHLVIAERLLGMRGEAVAIYIILHLGTVLSLLVFFAKDIIRLFKDIKYLFLIVVVTIVTGVIGVAGKDFFEKLFSSSTAVSIAWLATGIILLLTKKFIAAERKELNVKDALALGATQGISIIPGLSRSGITISTLLFRKIDREKSFQFSFLASIPAVLGATFIEAKEINFALKAEFKVLAGAFIISFLVGLFALWVLRQVLRKEKFHYFGYYCIFAAILTLLFVR